MYLTERDVAVLFDLAKFSCLTSKQMQKLHFNDYRYCRFRLSQMEADKYIRSERITFTGEKIFKLLKKGHEIVVEHTGAEFEYRKSFTCQTQHSVKVAQTYIAFKEKFDLINFDVEKDLDVVRPDAYCVINKEGKDLDFFIEVDLAMGKYSPKQFRKKVERYEELTRTPLAKYFNPFPPVLIITNFTGRVKKEIKEAKQLGINYYLTEYENLDKLDKEVFMNIDNDRRIKVV